jgi:hemerythrin
MATRPMDQHRPFLAWRHDWDSGVAFMDDEHRELAALLSDIAEKFAWAGIGADRRGSGLDPASTPLILALERLGRHAREHFLHEEEYMRALDYPQLEAHASEHALLLAEYTQLLRATRDCGAGRLDASTLDALKNWLLGHILDTDRRFADYCAARAHEVPARAL